MKYEIKDDNLIITVPIYDNRSNPYDEEYSEKFKQLVGYVNDKYSEYGFGFYIDMSYKGKADQDTGMFFQWLGGQDEFEKFCGENNIDIIYR